MNQTTRNKICFGLGTVGRDALYSLVSMYLLVHLTDVVKFSDDGLAVIGIILTLFGVFDAIIDPFVGAIVDNTKTRWGKFKPWILIGMIGTGILTVLMFHNFEMDEVSHIILLAITYLLFSIFFSLNDIAYWSLMPAISKDQQVILLGTTVLRMVALSEPFYGISIIVEGMLQGMGRTVFSLVINLVGMWAVRIIGTYLCIGLMDMGLIAAWGCMIGHNMLLFGVYCFYYSTGLWNPFRKKKKIQISA